MNFAHFISKFDNSKSYLLGLVKKDDMYDLEQGTC